MGKGRIYLEKFNTRVNGREIPADALIYENEDGKKTITDSASNEYVKKYIPTDEGVFYITNNNELHYLNVNGKCIKIKSDLEPTTKEVFISHFSEKVLYSNFGHIFAAGPDGVTMELKAQCNNYEFVGDKNEELYFFDSRYKDFFKVTYDSNEKGVIYRDIEKIKIIDDKIIYVTKCDYPADNRIYIADLSNPQNSKEVILIENCQRIIDFNLRNNILVYSCELFYNGDIIKLYSIDVNDSSKVKELYKWKKKYYFEEDRIELNDDKIVFQKQVELQKYEEWHISYDGKEQTYIRLIDESVDVKKILREVKKELREERYKEQIEIIKDPVTKGKKDGYSRAAKEFEPVLIKMREECESIRNLHIKNKKEQDKYSDELLDRLKTLEDEKKRLNRINEEKTKKVESTIGMSVGYGALCMPGILNPLLMIRKRKYNKAEIEGYIEARKTFEEKIEIEKNKIIELKNECNEDMKKILQFIADILNEIACVELRIAEMELMIGE